MYFGSLTSPTGGIAPILYIVSFRGLQFPPVDPNLSGQHIPGFERIWSLPLGPLSLGHGHRRRLLIPLHKRNYLCVCRLSVATWTHLVHVHHCCFNQAIMLKCNSDGPSRGRSRPVLTLTRTACSSGDLHSVSYMQGQEDT